MKSARYYGPRDLRIDEVEDPPAPKDNEITIDVSWGGICGTDLHEWTNGPMTVNTKDRPHGITGDYLPVAFGHEFTGRVSALPKQYPADGRLPVEDLAEHGLEELVRNKDDHVKIVATWREDLLDKTKL